MLLEYTRGAISMFAQSRKGNSTAEHICPLWMEAALGRPIIAINGRFDQDKCQRFVERSNREHHFGSPEPIIDGQLFRVLLEKGARDPYAVYRHSAHDRYIIRRSAMDVRLSPINSYALAIIESGVLVVKQAGRTLTISENQAVLIPMQLPYVVDQQPAKNTPFRVVYILIPAHAIDPTRLLPHELRLLHTSDMQAKMIDRILYLLFENSGELGHETSRSLFNALARQVACLMERPQGHERQSRDSQNGELWSHALDYIETNFSNRLLNLKSLALALNVSPRTLMYLFGHHNATFSSILWDTRLSAIRNWLSSPTMSDVPIQQLALAAGFKSAAHLSTKFKEKMNCSPSAFRMSLRTQG